MYSRFCETVCSGVGKFGGGNADEGGIDGVVPVGGWPARGEERGKGLVVPLAVAPKGDVVRERTVVFVSNPGSDTPLLLPNLVLVLVAISTVALCALRNLSNVSR
jgi:hypothetical protein